MAQVVRLTKTGGSVGVCIFGRLDKGTVLDIRVPAAVVAEGEQEAKIRARKILEREHPDENQMEWNAELAEAEAA